MSDVLDELEPIANDVIERWASNGFAGLRQGDQIFLLVWGYGSEVGNGGHAQFFYNSLGEYAAQTVDALIAVECLEFAELLERCIRRFPNRKVPQDITERNGLLETVLAAFEQDFKVADQEFFKADGCTWTLERLLRFWRTQPAA